MPTLVKDKIYNFRTNTERLNEAKAFLAEEGRDLPTVLNAVIDQIALTKTVPVKTQEEIDAEAFLDELSHSLNSALDEVLAGNFVTKEELEARLGI